MRLILGAVAIVGTGRNMSTDTVDRPVDPAQPLVALEICHAHTPTDARPPRWKQALATLLALYPTVVVASTHIGPRLGDKGWGWPGWLITLVVTSTAVITLAWGLMPLVTRVLATWLTPPATVSAQIRTLQTLAVLMTMAAVITIVALTT